VCNSSNCLHYRHPPVSTVPYVLRSRPSLWTHWTAVSLQVTWVINLAVGCRYFLPGLQLSSQPLRWLLPILLLGEERHGGCEQFAYDCYPAALQLRFEPRPYCTESSTITTRLPSHPISNLLNEFLQISFKCYLHFYSEFEITDWYDKNLCCLWLVHELW